MLVSSGQIRFHLLFAVPAMVLVTVPIVMYWNESAAAGIWVGGGSKTGLLCGMIAGGIILFEMLLWPRKLLRRFRLIPAKFWMAAHLWFGLASLPLAIVHCGFHLGGWFPTTLMLLFVLTAISGVYGLFVQNVLPRWMLRHLPRETIYNQIDYVSEQAVEDARRLLTSACGSDPTLGESVDAVPDLATAEVVVVGAVRQAGKTRGRTLETRHFAESREDREPLWNAFNELRPFLLDGGSAITPFSDRKAAAVCFGRLRSACVSESHSLIDVLESLCDQRHEFDLQQRLHRWLHVWVPVHVGLSIAVTILLLTHIYTALKYW